MGRGWGLDFQLHDVVCPGEESSTEGLPCPERGKDGLQGIYVQHDAR